MIKKKVKKTEKHNLENIESTTNTKNIEVKDINGYLSERLYFDDFFDDGRFKKFLKNVERLVRSSNAYKSFIGACHEKGLNHCAILGNVYASKEVTIEIHHYPFTLYDICYLVVMDHIDHNDKFTSISIAKEVLQLHIDGLVSVVPLCKTVHKLAHEGEIFINLLSCYGNLNEFLELYEKDMDLNMKKSYNQIYEMSEKGISYSENDILKKVEKFESKFIDKEEKVLIEDEENLLEEIDENELNNEESEEEIIDDSEDDINFEDEE